MWQAHKKGSIHVANIICLYNVIYLEFPFRSNLLTGLLFDYKYIIGPVFHSSNEQGKCVSLLLSGGAVEQGMRRMHHCDASGPGRLPGKLSHAASLLISI